MEKQQQPMVFKGLVSRILEDPDFSQVLLAGKPEAQKEALYAYLDEVGFEGEMDAAFDHLNEVLERTDLEAINRLVETMDGPIEMPW